MSPITVTIIASFILAFKSILVEGSEIVILSLETVSQLGKRNVLLDLIAGVVLFSFGAYFLGTCLLIQFGVGS